MFLGLSGDAWCLRKGLLGTSGTRSKVSRNAKNKYYLAKTKRYLIPHVTHSCMLSWKEGWLVSLRAWHKKTGFFAMNWAMVKTLLSGIENPPEEFSKFCEISHQMSALSSGFMDLHK